MSRRRGVSGARTVARRSESVDLFMASARMRYGPRAMKPGNEGLSRGRALVALALTSALIVAHEVLITRLLSVVTWYGLAFVVLSIAMLGLTAGSLQAYRARELDEPIGPWIARRAAYFAVAIVGSTGVTLCVPLTPDPSGTALAALLAVAGANAIPMTLGGGIVARIMAESDAPVGIVYAVDLVAAALGALSPLVILGPLDGPSALIILGAFAALIAFVASPTRWMRGAALGGALALALIGVANNGAQRGLRVRFVKTAFIPLQVVPFFQGWNALSNIFVYPPGTVNARDALWAPSVHTPTMPAHIATAQIDGEAGTHTTLYHDLSELEFLRYDATNVVHWIRPDGLACVIGVGGGRDLASALVFGHPQALGVEINPLLVRMLRDASPILHDPRVSIVIGDGRSELAARRPHCRTLQASLVDTWAATGAGAFSHTEATLYTREAWSLLLERVEPDGVLTFSRWYSPTQVSETARLVALAMSALLDRHVADPRAHFAVITSGRVATIVVSPTPLRANDVATLHARAHELEFNVLFAPDQPPTEPVLRALLATREVSHLADAGRARNLDTSPATDDRPFFFQLLAPRAWLHPLNLLHIGLTSVGVISGNVLATVQLMMTFLAVSVIALLLLGPPLYRAARSGASLPGWRPGMYFAMLGAGFMLTEIALVQRMHVVLGHPTFALVVVLAGLLVCTGIGSALSTRFVRSRKAVTGAAIGAALLLFVLPYAVIGPLARATLAAPLALRIVWTGACAGLVGVILGMLFPSAIRYVHRDRGVPVALALNGVTSVLGSVLAIVVSVALGIAASFAVAAVFYLLAAWAGPHRWREETSA